MLEIPKAFRNILNISAADISFRKQIRHCKNRKMQSWSFGKHKRKYITDNNIDMKIGPDVINSAAYTWKK